MTKKNEKRLCWNCDGNVSMLFSRCPYCAVDLTQNPNPSQSEENPRTLSSFQTPQNTPQANQIMGSPFQPTLQEDQSVPQSPYGNFHHFDVSETEWNQALDDAASGEKVEDEEHFHSSTSEKAALLLILPGVVFMLFGLILFFFSKEGVLTLQWKKSFSYFYFIGAIPLLYVGWRSLKKQS